MILKCEKFILRPLQLDDAESIAKYANNYKIWKNLRDLFPHPYSIGDAKNFINYNIDINPTENFCIEYQNECIGIIGFNQMQDVYKKTVDFGYWIGEKFWNKGIISKAIPIMVRYIFDTFEIERIQASVFSWNKSSMHVLKKNGFKLEYIAKNAVFKNNVLTDEYCYIILKKSNETYLS